MNVWESRKETLSVLFRKILEVGDKLPPEDAVIYSHPACDTMLLVFSSMENLRLEKEVDNLLNNILSDENPQQP